MDRRTFVASLAAGSLASWPSAGAQERVAAVRARAAGLAQLRALVVAIDGEIVLAEAFRGGPLTRPANVKSVSKTLVATLAGAAIERGFLPGVDAPALDYLPAPRGIDPRAAEVTIEDLLTMRSGFARTSGASYGAWVQSGDWVGYILSQPMIDAPGMAFSYSTGDFHLLSAVLTRATGATLHEIAGAWIAAPLRIEIPPWTRDPQGIFMGGNEMALSPMAMLAFAEAIRTGGGGMVSPDWIAASWRPQTRSPFSGHDYGYGWFLARMAGEDFAYARGYGGQMIYVSRGARLSVALTSDPTLPARSGGHVGDLHALVEDLVPLARG